MPDFNERLLKEIAHLGGLKESNGIESARILHGLEILRYVRNSELFLTFEEGLKQEDEWIKQNTLFA